MISPLISQKINELQEAIVNERRAFVLLRWANGKQTSVFARRGRLLEDILALQKNHESYLKAPHVIASVNRIEPNTSKSRIQSATPRL